MVGLQGVQIDSLNPWRYNKFKPFSCSYKRSNESYIVLPVIYSDEYTDLATAFSFGFMTNESAV
jgi:hypothetical protein